MSGKKTHVLIKSKQDVDGNWQDGVIGTSHGQNGANRDLTIATKDKELVDKYENEFGSKVIQTITPEGLNETYWSAHKDDIKSGEIPL